MGALNTLGDRPWSELKTGKEIHEQWLARQLRHYSARPKLLWIEGTIARGYSQEDLTDSFRRYIPASELAAMKAATLEAAAHPEAGAQAPGLYPVPCSLNLQPAAQLDRHFM